VVGATRGRGRRRRTMAVKQEYGVVIYDVPTTNMKMWYRLRNRIGAQGIRMNLSAYLVPWGRRAAIQQIVEQARIETGQYAAVSIIKFDNSEENELAKVAEQSMVRELEDIGKRLKKTVEKARENCKDISDRYIRTVEKKLELAEGLAVVFGLTGDFKIAMDSAKQIFLAEVDALRAERSAKSGKGKGSQTAHA